MREFDVIVVGGGHAGAEAAMLAARRGARTLMITQNLESIGQMSCNPAIGGVAKGTVVREVDALGGIMGRAADRAGIQFRMLNRSKGPAVWSPRAQCDRGLYRRQVRFLLETLPGLAFAQGTVGQVVMTGGRVTGIETEDGRRYRSRAVVITAGTFLRGRIHMGTERTIAAGRAGDTPSVSLSEAIVNLGVTFQRFKTGTPPRVDGRTVDFSAMLRQDGDEPPFRFSHYEAEARPDQLPCFLTHTGPALREVVEANLGRTALYGGAISGQGPRYCPSIEDKIVRFPSSRRHQVFLEPEGLETAEMYVNGLSTSLPPEVQVGMLRTVRGLERVEMTRPGYAIEYDYFPPTQLHPTLAVKGIPGLYFAGQINGTTGYEEAAGQGVMAGLNAAAWALDLEPVSFPREASFLGVLADDLVTKGVDEPYRLFTSRAEYRLTLRQDNALRRLYPIASGLDLLTEGERRAADARLEREDRLLGEVDSGPVSTQLLQEPTTGLEHLLPGSATNGDREAITWVETEVRYRGYIARERRMALRLRQMEAFQLPDGVEYTSLTTLSHEAREKLSRVRPATLGQAGRIPGVTPADLQNLVVETLKLKRRAKTAT